MSLATLTNLPLKNKSQRGIALTPLLIFIALAVMAVGFIAVMNRGPSTNTSVQQNQLSAGAVLGQAASLASGYAFAVGSGGVTIDAVTLGDPNDTNSLFNVSKNWAIPQSIPSKACDGACSWTLDKTTYSTVGSASTDIVLVAANIKPDVCSQLHQELYSSPTVFADVSAAQGNYEGCIGTTFFKVLTPK